MVFTLRQEGGMLTGSLETSTVAGFGGGSSGGPIEEGRIDGSGISFRVGTTTYTGSVQGDQIELRRSAPSGRGGAREIKPKRRARRARHVWTAS